MAAVAVPNVAIGILILVFRKRLRAFIKSLVPRMSGDAEFWTSRVVIISGLFLIAVPTFLACSALSSALTK